MNKKSLLSLVLVGALSIGVTAGTYAWFTSKADSKLNIFTTKTLSIGLNANQNSQNVEQDFAVAANLKPGDIVTKNADGTPGHIRLDVVNNGQYDVAYLANFELGGDKKLGDAIFISYWRNNVTKADGNTTIFYEPQAFITYDEATDTNRFMYQWYKDNVDKNNDGRISLNEWLADYNNANGNANGWENGSLKPGSKFENEIELRFAKDAGNDYQNRVMTIAYKALATQFEVKDGEPTQNSVAAFKHLMDNNGVKYNDAYWILKEFPTKRLALQ